MIMTLKAHGIVVATITIIAFLAIPAHGEVMRIDGTVPVFSLNSMPLFNPDFAPLSFGDPFTPSPCCLATKFDNLPVGPFTMSLRRLDLAHTGEEVISGTPIGVSFYMAFSAIPGVDMDTPSKVIMVDSTRASFLFSFSDITASTDFAWHTL
jgi:hypothetical protein